MAETRILLARSPHGFLAQVGDPDTLIQRACQWSAIRGDLEFLVVPGDSIRDAHWPADG
jgi:hypothetical protein